MLFGFLLGTFCHKTKHLDLIVGTVIGFYYKQLNSISNATKFDQM